MLCTTKNHKIETYLSIDVAAGLCVQGEFEKAKKILNSVNKSNLSTKNGTLLTYIINMIICSYGLGDISYAEELFETQIPLLSPLNSSLSKGVESLIAKRYLYKNRCEEAKEIYQKLLKGKISKRRRIEILYTLAHIDETNGDVDSAKQKYIEVSENGNKLLVAFEARKRLEGM